MIIIPSYIKASVKCPIYGRIVDHFLYPIPNTEKSILWINNGCELCSGENVCRKCISYVENAINDDIHNSYTSLNPLLEE